jgi:hypothetical protein
MFNLNGQINQLKQQAKQAGFSGTGILDIQPTSGVIRIKLNTVPAENLSTFTERLSQCLAMVLNGMNIQVKVHIEEKR